MSDARRLGAIMTSAAAQVFTIHQTLHGYEGGHRLLASSLKMPKDAERTMLLLSDLSGPSGGVIFEPYLTGYPVNSISRYALARTWPAPEMGRPGCVWTHTLLIDFETIEHVRSLQFLVRFFNRPDLGTGHSRFRVPIEYTKVDTTDYGTPSFTLEAALALHSLVHSPSGRIVVSVPSYHIAEGPLLTIWDSLWPSIRESFTFCSGAKMPRVLEGRLFDIQAVMDKDLGRFQRRAEESSIEYIRLDASDVNPKTLEPWFEFVSEGAGSQYFIFGKKVCANLSLSFVSLRVATELYFRLHEAARTSPVSATLSYLAMEFPAADDGAEYKQFFLGDDDPLNLTDEVMLDGLIRIESQESFNVSTLRIAERASEIWRAPNSALALSATAVQFMGNSIAKAVATGLATSIPEKRIPAVVALDGAFSCFLRCNPNLATCVEIWRVPEALQRRVIDALAASKDQLRSFHEVVVKNLLEVQVDVGWSELFGIFGDDLIEDVLSQSERRGYQKFPGNCGKLLMQHPIVVSEWLNAKQSVPASLLWAILSAMSTEMQSSSVTIVKAVAKHLGEQSIGNVNDQNKLSVYLLAIALGPSFPGAGALARISLDSVYDATARSKMPEADWSVFSHLLPKAEWWRSWDKCARIRRAVANKFLCGEWPVTSFLSLTRNDDLFRGIANEIRRQPHGTAWLSQAGALSSSEMRRKILLELEEFLD